MGTAIKHPVQLSRSSFVIFDIWALRRSGLSVRVPGLMSKITNGRLNPVWLYPYGNSGRQMVKVTGQQ